ncbi:hypothetical protein EGW08_003115, partial [Elysia chlorotica]
VELAAVQVVLLQVQRAEVALDRPHLPHLLPDDLEPLAVAGRLLLVVELGETPLDHVLDPQLLHPHQVQDHRVRQAELRLQACGFALAGGGICHLKSYFKFEDHSPRGVETPPPRAPRHLDVLPWEKVPEAHAVVLPYGVKDDGSCRHVDAHGESFCGEKYLSRRGALLEQHLHNFLQNGQDPAVMNPEPTLQHTIHALVKEDVDFTFLRGCCKVDTLQVYSVLLDLSLGEGEGHCRKFIFPLQHLYHRKPCVFVLDRDKRREKKREKEETQRETEIRTEMKMQDIPSGEEIPLCVLQEKQLVAGLGTVPHVEIVFQGNRSLQGVHHVNLLAFDFPLPDPGSKLHGVGYGRTQQDDIDVLGQHDEDFLPDHAPLAVVDVVHLVEDNPLKVTHDVRAVKILPQNFCGHDEAGCSLVELYVPCDQSNIAKGQFEISELLVRQSFDRGRIN